MTHIARIESSVKAGIAADLAPCTLVVGDNASGKSGLVASIELALTGRCAEAGAAGASILEMARGGRDARVAAKLSDGREVRFAVEGTTARAKKPVWTVGSAVGKDVDVPTSSLGALLVGEVADLLARDAKRLREALVSICCGPVDAASITARLPEAFRAEWARYWDRARYPIGQVADADALVGAAEQIRADLRAARSALRVADPSRPDAPSEEAVARARTEVERLRAEMKGARDRQAAFAAARGAWLRAEEDLPGLRGRLMGLEAQLGGADPAPLREALECIEAARVLAIRCLHGCLACGGAAPAQGWTARLDDLNERRVAIGLDLQTALRAPAVDEIERARAAVQAAEETIQRSRDTIGTIIQATEGIVPEAPDESPLRAAEAHLREMEAARACLDAWQAAARDRALAAARVTTLKALSEVADRIVADVLDGQVEAFAARASAMLPHGPNGTPRRAAIALRDGTRAICRVGIEDGDGTVRSWRALSGAERAVLLAGLAAAWGASRIEDVRMAIVDETWLSRGALAHLCGALAGAVASGALTQAIVCAVDDYGIAPEGWRVVRLA